MRAAFSGWLSTAIRRYKRDFHNNVRQESGINVKNYLFVDPPQIATIGSDAAAEMAELRYNKWYDERLDRTEYSALTVIQYIKSKTVYPTLFPSKV